MPYLYIVAALVVLVVLHELGHFLAAKAVGIRATKFYVFFPPALFSRTVGDVEYGIGAIPAGGFVKLPGMFEPVPAEVAERLRWEFEDIQPLLHDADLQLRLDAARRAIANAPSPDDIVEPLEDARVVLETMLAQDGRTPEQAKVIDRVRERVVGLLDDAHPRAYWRAALWRRMTVIFAGPFVNLVIAFLVLWGFFWLSTPKEQLEAPIRAGTVTQGSPADEAGIEKGTPIYRWNGPIEGISVAEFRDRLQDGRGKDATLTFKDEDGNRVTRTIRPAVLEQGADPRLGILLTDASGTTRVVGHERTSAGEGAQVAFAQMRYITVENLSRLPRVFFDREVREGVGSVVGIVQVAREVDDAGFIIGYIAFISLILAVMNLLPLLPLDGGHLLFGLLEAIRRGRPMPRAAFERYSLIGMALVLMLFVIGLDNDIERIRG